MKKAELIEKYEEISKISKSKSSYRKIKKADLFESYSILRDKKTAKNRIRRSKQKSKRKLRLTAFIAVKEAMKNADSKLQAANDLMKKALPVS